MNEFLLIEAAADGSKPKVVGLAYGGGKMNLPGWKFPVVVDLSGMQIPEQIPLLLNHENRTSSRVGMISAKVEQNTLTIEGEIIAKGEQADGIVEQAKSGADWQLSIGAEVLNSELVKDKRTVNGQDFEGSFFHVSKSLLREVSVVAVGADMTTRMKVAASFNLSVAAKDKTETPESAPSKNPVVQSSIAGQENKKEETIKENPQANLDATKENRQVPENPPTKNPMIHASGAETNTTKKENDTVGKEKGLEVGAEVSAEKQKKDDAAGKQVTADVDVAVKAIQQERDRVSKIQAMCAGEFPEIEREAISAGWTQEETSQKVLKAIREKRPASDVNVMVKRKPEGVQQKKSLEAAMCIRVGISGDDLIKQYGEEAVETAWKENNMPLQMLLIECLKLEGAPVPRSFGNETIQAAFSTMSLPGILSNVANKKLLQSFQSQPVIATKLCSEGDLSDFKENERFRLTDVGDLEKVPDGGEIKEGGLSEEKALNQLDTYGKKFCLTRKMIINDDLGAFMKVPVAMGNRSARLIDQLFFKRLMGNPSQSDGKTLFHADHKNLLEGTTSVLAAEGLRLAIKMFLDQVDIDGQPITIEPRFLLVPTGLKHTAIELTKGATLIIAGGDATSGTIPTIRPALNSLVDENLQVVSAPYLANSKYDGNSEKSWYLFGNPAQTDTFEIGYLRGNRVPTVERGDTDFNTLGLWFRVYFDLGIREQDHRGMVKSKGE